MLRGTRLCGLLAALAVVGATAVTSAEAAIIQYDFEGTMDNAIVDFGGVDAPAGTAFTGSFSYHEDAPEVGSNPGLPLQRQFAGNAFRLSIAGVAEPLFDTASVPGGELTIATTPYGMVSVGFSQPGEGGEPDRGGFLNIFPTLALQILNPLLLLPDADDLESFALAALAFGESNGPADNPDDFQGTVDNIVPTPLPPAAWLFLTAIAGLVVMRYRRW